MSNIYDYDYRWRFTHYGLELLHGSEMIRRIPLIMPEDTDKSVSGLRKCVLSEEENLRLNGVMPQDARIDRFAFPAGTF